MSHLGFMVMINQLLGSPRSCQPLVDAFEQKKIISSARLVDHEIILEFDDGSGVKLLDDGQSCCEHRYLHTDDDLNQLVGGYLVDIEEAEIDLPAPKEGDDDWGEDHEACFLRIKTSRGTAVVEAHNVHNGYYGGFYLVVRPLGGDGSED